jgi:DNA-binding GntR family transcriptional regulator
MYTKLSSQADKGKIMSRASDRAYSMIRDKILSGALRSGAKVGETSLAEQCGVSRTPIREALGRLEAELLIRRNETQRSFVADWSLDDVEESFELRAMLEGRATRRAASRINDEQIGRMRMHNHALGKAVTSDIPDTQLFLDHNQHFHSIILEASASQRLTNVLSRLIEQPVIWRTVQNFTSEDLQQSFREHEELLAAFERHDPAWAEAVITSHIRRAFHTYATAHMGQRDAEVVLAAE